MIQRTQGSVERHGASPRIPAPRRFTWLLTLFISLLVPWTSAHAQSWTRIAGEDDSFTVGCGGAAVDGTHPSGRLLRPSLLVARTGQRPRNYRDVVIL